MVIGTRFVRDAMAAAIVIGDGRKPSSTPWCSDSVTMSTPCSSAHADCSRQAAYISGCLVAAQSGERRS
jgi:hypothetical protein